MNKLGIYHSSSEDKGREKEKREAIIRKYKERTTKIYVEGHAKREETRRLIKEGDMSSKKYLQKIHAAMQSIESIISSDATEEQIEKIHLIADEMVLAPYQREMENELVTPYRDMKEYFNRIRCVAESFGNAEQKKIYIQTQVESYMRKYRDAFL